MGREVLLALGMWFVCLMTVTLFVARWILLRQRRQARVFADVFAPSQEDVESEQGWLARWLFVAGFRGPRAVPAFLGLTVLCGACGALLVFALQATTLFAGLAKTAVSIPGGVGEVFLPLILAGPWLIIAMLTTIPTLVVRAARRRRVRQVEQDLPIVLELLATLAEAGLGLDAAISRVLDSLPPQRVLAQELRAFQRDNLAGRSRVDSLRWLGRRVAVPWLSVFISAVVQADQIGAGLSDVLKIQAEDLRQRRKDQALSVASSAPVKLLVPLILCFIPGILTAALGPTLFDILQTLNSLIVQPLGTR